VLVTAPATNYTDSGLSATTTYSYTVSAVDNANNQSAQSGGLNVTTLACACGYSISPTSVSFSSSGGSGTVNVTTGPICAWTATSNVPWITITSATSGTTSGAVNYQVAPNTSVNTLTGTLTIAGQTLTVSQSGTGGTDTTPPSISVTAPAGGTTVSNQIQIVANASDNVGVTTVQFYADNLGSWVLIGTQTGTGAGPANYTLSYNTTNLANGGHNFLCKAYDAAGNSSYSFNGVTVANFNADPGIMSWAKDVGQSLLTGEAQNMAVKTDSQGNVVVVHRQVHTCGSTELGSFLRWTV
jgi:hypothetical protein